MLKNLEAKYHNAYNLLKNGSAKSRQSKHNISSVSIWDIWVFIILFFLLLCTFEIFHLKSLKRWCHLCTKKQDSSFSETEQYNVYSSICSMHNRKEEVGWGIGVYISIKKLWKDIQEAKRNRYLRGRVGTEKKRIGMQVTFSLYPFKHFFNNRKN